MPTEELHSVLEKVTGLRTRTQLSQLVILRKYVQWCLASRIPGARDDLLNIKTAGIDKVRSQMVASPRHLQACLDLVFAPESDESIDNMYRAYFWLAFSGLEDVDAFRLTRQHFDFERMVISLDGVEYRMCHEGIPAIRNLVLLPSYQVFRGGMQYRLYRYPSDLIMRGIKGVQDHVKIRAELSRRFKQSAQVNPKVSRLSYDRVQTSGLFYETYELEHLGYEPDFRAVAERYEKRTQTEEISQEFIDKRKRAIENDYMNDYLRWKLAFYN